MQIVTRKAGISAAAVLASAVLSACSHLHCPPDEEEPVCRPEHYDALHPRTGKVRGFPQFKADVSHEPRTLAFQVCDSATGDLNGDGRPEIVVADHIRPGFGYFLNDPALLGDQVFNDGVGIPIKGRKNNSAGVALADFNGDGKLDVANSNHPGTMTVSLNATRPGASKLDFPSNREQTYELGVAHGREYGLAGREGGLVIADFNGDGRPDVATANLGKTKIAQAGRADHCLRGDSEASRYSSTIMLNTTEPGASEVSFTPKVHFPISGPAISIASADFDLDGNPDLVTADTGSSSLSILINNTVQIPDALPCFKPALKLAIPSTLEQGAGPTNPLAIDLNDDGKPDLASANWNERTITVWINLTNHVDVEPTFSEPAVISTGKIPPLLVRGGDLDSDGLNDLVVVPLSTHSSAAMMVLRNDTARGGETPEFVFDAVYQIPEKLRQGWLYTYFSSAGVVRDFDGDGFEDIGVIVARGSFLLKAMKAGNDILEYVDPGVPLWVVHPVLPQHSILVVFERTEEHKQQEVAVPVCEPIAVAMAEGVDGQEIGICERARNAFLKIERDVVELDPSLWDEQSETPDASVRAAQAALSASELRVLARDVPEEYRTDIETVAAYIERVSSIVLSEPSVHVDHEVEDAVGRLTLALHEECGG